MCGAGDEGRAFDFRVVCCGAASVSMCPQMRPQTSSLLDQWLLTAAKGIAGATAVSSTAVMRRARKAHCSLFACRV